MRLVPAYPRWRSAAAAILLFGLGVVAGAAADRMWLRGARPAAAAAPLTPEALAEALDLTVTERARLTALFDSLRLELATAAAAGPESLALTARAARARVEETLPPDRRERFHEWMGDHHRQIMENMHRGGAAHGHRRAPHD